MQSNDIGNEVFWIQMLQCCYYGGIGIYFEFVCTT